jgi:multicomponent Na+:H+ antiporter subunit D
MMLLIPFLIPLFTSLVSIFLRGRLQTSLNLLSSGLLLLSAVLLLIEVSTNGNQSIALGNWPLPYAIEFAVDGLSALMVLLIAVVSSVVLIYQSDWKETAEKFGTYPLLHALVAACIAVSMAADLFNLYVWFELMLVTVLGLFILGGNKQHHEAALKYFTISMLGTLLMLAAVGLIYATSGHLNFDALRLASQDPVLGDSMQLYSGLLFIALLLKIGAFPLFAWLPAAYHTLPAPLLALVGGLLTKISLYVALRLSGQVFDLQLLHESLGWLAVITMLSGVVGAAYHWDLRRILAFHIVSQIGYLLLGIALASSAAATATSFFLFHNILVKTNLFLIAGLIWMSAGHYDLRRIGGLFPARPLIAVLFVISALSLVGVPPSSGFWGKLLLLQEAFDQQRFVWGGIALFTGILTLYSMSKIWLEGFWKPSPANAITGPVPWTAYAATVGLSIVILIMGLAPDSIIAFLQAQSADYWSIKP